MRDPARIDKIIRHLRTLWEYQPDARLCQLVYNTAWRAAPGRDMFFLEDDKFLEALEHELGGYIG